MSKDIREKIKNKDFVSRDHNSKYLKLAFHEAQKAYLKDEVPVGAVIVYQNKIIARAHNLREKQQSVLGHAELLAIQKASKKLGSWRLEECEVYVSLEPCPMCAAALQQSRVLRVVYAAKDPKGGAVSLGFKLESHPNLNHRYEMVFHKNKNCGKILSDFFQQKRQKRKHENS